MFKNAPNITENTIESKSFELIKKKQDERQE